ncbi:hypothetical protein B0J11DRAFT_204204 [Dendryphion nanum]|uniref:Uncharacterized protein n=1 Tax=Dendryphion nanum TaxID=256645 RepID=A0A9P9I7B6_9PLEO|nr:hypothetical protein B0J11DRAFT_204204 [Dendryphion nanum]
MGNMLEAMLIRECLQMAALSTQPHILNYLFSLGIGVSCSRDQLYGIIPGTMLSFLALFPMINPFRGGSFELILSIIGERVESISDCYDGMIDSLDNNNTTLDYPIWSAEIPMRYLQYSQERIKNPWRVLFFQYGYRLFQPTSTVRRFWQLALCDGLIDPDYSIFGMHHAPLLQRALYGMVQITDRGRIANDEQQYDEEQYEDTLCIVKLLILAGANIHHMSSRSVEIAQRWTDVRTPTKDSINLGIRKQWEQALKECGLNVEEVFRQDKKNRKQELRLRGARRSGVDESVLDLPSWNGIRCRRCQKKYCNHGFE